MDLSRFSFVISFAFYDGIVDFEPLTFGRIAIMFLKITHFLLVFCTSFHNLIH
jgi:hypothetical protein